MSSSWLNCAWISATSIAPSATPAFCAASVADGAVARSRSPRCCGSTRCSMPRIQAGRSQYCFGDVVGRDHDRRRAVGDGRDVAVAQRSVRHRPAEQVVGARRPRRRPRAGCPARCGRLRAATSARSRSVRPDAREVRVGLQRGHVDHRRPQRRHRVRVGLQRPDLVQVTERRLAEAVDDARCRRRRSGSRPTPRRAPRPRPSRRGSPSPAATRRRRRDPCTKVNGPPAR